MNSIDFGSLFEKKRGPFENSKNAIKSQNPKAQKGIEKTSDVWSEVDSKGGGLWAPYLNSGGNLEKWKTSYRDKRF